MVMKYRKLPVEIEAIEWTGENLKEVISFTGRDDSLSGLEWGDFESLVSLHGLKIFTLEGSHFADVGDMIIKGVAGEFYPCKPGIFKATYEKT